MDVEEGWKISRYVELFREPDYASFEDSRKVVAVLRRLHSSGVEVSYGLRPWEDACRIEHYISEKTFDAIKKHVDKYGSKNSEERMQ